MDAYFVLSLIASLTITAAIYGAFPLLFARFRKSDITRKTYKMICISETVIVALCFGVLNALNGSQISFSPALIWGIFFYNIGIKILKKRGILLSENTSDDTQPKEVVFQYVGEEIVDVPNIESISPISNGGTTKKHSANMPIIILSLLLTTSLCGAGLCFWKWQEKKANMQAKIDANQVAMTGYRDRISKLQRERDDLSQEYGKAEQENRFIEKNVVFVTEGGKRYHRYDCHYFQDASSFYVFNVEYARALGYTPCLECNPPK